MKTILATLLFALAASASADEAAQHDSARRAELHQQRQAIQKTYVKRQAECRDKFAVNNCLATARGEMQAATKSVREQELELNDAARERKAAANAQRLNDKAAAARARQDATPPVAAHSPASGASRPAPAHGAGLPKLSKPSTPRTTQDEAGARERFEARQRDIRAHREEVEKRNAARAKNSPATRSLPVPTAASAAAGG
jgi:hypothetical protein